MHPLFTLIKNKVISPGDYLEATKPAAVNYVFQDGGNTAVIDIDGYIGRDIMREWLTGKKSENSAETIKAALREIRAPKIIVNICSEAGDHNDAIVIYDLLRAKKSEVITNIYGFTAAAGTIVAQGGDVRRMSRNSFQLFQKASLPVNGFVNQNTMKSLSRDLEVIDKQIFSVYSSRSKIEYSKLKDLLNARHGYGRWMGSDEAESYRFVDQVFDASDKNDENIDRLSVEGSSKMARNQRRLVAQALHRANISNHIAMRVEKLNREQKQLQYKYGTN